MFLIRSCRRSHHMKQVCGSETWRFKLACSAAARGATSNVDRQALGCSPTSCAPAWSTPSATRCRAWWKSTRPAFHSGPKTILPPEGKDAATTARYRRRHRTRGRKHPRPPAAGRNLLLRRRRPRTLRRNRRRSRRHRENRRLVRLRCGPRRSPQCPCRREDRRSPRPAVDPPSLLQPQRMGARRLPRAASQASAGLSR